MGPPETTIWEYPGADESWRREFAEFPEDIRLGRQPAAGLGEARAALEVVEADLCRLGFHGSIHMIITRSPLRITLGGGGTDLPSYYREHGGFLIAAAIDKYVYVTVMRPFVPGIFLKYSQLEHVTQVDEVQHPIIREALRMVGVAHAADRDHHAGRHSGRHRPRLVRQLHHRAAEGAVRAPAPPAPPGGARRAGLRDRDQPARRADRQAGSVHRGLRRRDLLHVLRPTTPSRRGRCRCRWRRCSTSKTTCCCSSPGSRAAPGSSWRTRTPARATDDAGDDREPALRQGARLPAVEQTLETGELADFGELMHEHWEHKRSARAA